MDKGLAKPRARGPAGGTRRLRGRTRCSCHGTPAHRMGLWKLRHLRWLPAFKSTRAAKNTGPHAIARIESLLMSGDRETPRLRMCAKAYMALRTLSKSGSQPPYPSNLRDFSLPVLGGHIHVRFSTDHHLEVIVTSHGSSETLPEAERVGVLPVGPTMTTASEWVDKVLTAPPVVEKCGCGRLVLRKNTKKVAPCVTCSPSCPLAGVEQHRHAASEHLGWLRDHPQELIELAEEHGGSPAGANNFVSIGKDFLDNLSRAPRGRRYSDHTKVFAAGLLGRGRYEALQRALPLPTARLVHEGGLHWPFDLGIDEMGLLIFAERLVRGGEPNSVVRCLLGWDETRCEASVLVKGWAGGLRTFGLAPDDSMGRAHTVQRWTALVNNPGLGLLEYPYLAAILRLKAASQALIVVARGLGAHGVHVEGIVFRQPTQSATGEFLVATISALVTRLIAARVVPVAGVADGLAANCSARTVLSHIDWAGKFPAAYGKGTLGPPVWPTDAVHLGKTTRKHVITALPPGVSARQRAQSCAVLCDAEDEGDPFRGLVDSEDDDSAQDEGSDIDHTRPSASTARRATRNRLAPVPLRASLLAPAFSSDRCAQILKSPAQRNALVNHIRSLKKCHSAVEEETAAKYCERAAKSLTPDWPARIPEPTTWWTPTMLVPVEGVHGSNIECPTPTETEPQDPVECELFPSLLPLARQTPYPHSQWTLATTRSFLLAPVFSNADPARPHVRDGAVEAPRSEEMMSTTLFTDLCDPATISQMSSLISPPEVPLFLALLVLGQLADPRSPTRSGKRARNRVAYLHQKSYWWGYVQSFTASWRQNNDQARDLLRTIARIPGDHNDPAEVRELAQFVDQSRPPRVWFAAVAQFISHAQAAAVFRIPAHICREQNVEWAFARAKSGRGHKPSSEALMASLHALNLIEYGGSGRLSGSRARARVPGGCHTSRSSAPSPGRSRLSCAVLTSQFAYPPTETHSQSAERRRLHG